MINDLLLAMSFDMNIERFYGETEDFFIYRLCYSALGQWCLRTTQNLLNGVIGSTKYNQTIILNEKLVRFSELFPNIANMFMDINNRHVNFSVHIRRVYEETGYLLTGNDNQNRIANYGRSISFDNKALFFGIPITEYSVNGLGVFAYPTKYIISSKEFMIRDDLSCEDYFRSQFDSIDFYERDIGLDELEFFNPKLNRSPSLSWGKQMEVECTIARKNRVGPFYRVMFMSDVLKFAEEPIEQQNDCFTSHEYRRLYFALKEHYKTPLEVNVTKIDMNYSKIRIGGYLPNREYYYLLLLSWPINNAFDKTNFLIHNDLLPEAIAVLVAIGVKIKGGNINYG